MDFSRVLTKAFVLLTACVLVACDGGYDDSNDDAPPGGGPPGSLTLVSSTPTAQATDVARTDDLVLTFSASLNTSTVNTSTVSLQSEKGAEPIAVAADGARITVTPAVSLLPRTRYTLRVETGVRSASGGALSDAVVLTFTSRTPEWQTAALIEDDDSDDARDPALAVDAQGNAFAVWRHGEIDENTSFTHGGIRAARYSAATRTWSAPQNVGNESPQNVDNPLVVVDGEGNAFAAWLEETGGVTTLSVNRYDAADEAWGQAERVSPDEPGQPSAGSPEIVVDERGVAYVLFEMNSEIRVGRYDPESGWDGTTVLSSAGLSQALSAKATVDPEGNVLAVWWQFTGPGSDVVLMSRRREAESGTWGAPTVVSRVVDGSFGRADIKSDAAGNGMVVWTQGEDSEEVWWSRYSAADSRWSEQDRVATGVAGELSNLVLAVDSQGNMAAGWSQFQDPGSSIHIARYSVASGSWTSANIVESSTDDSSEPRLVFDVNDDLLAVWAMGDDAARHILSARNVFGTDTWSTPMPIDDPDENTAADGAQIGIDTSGSGLVVWSGFDGTRFNIWSSTLE